MPKKQQKSIKNYPGIAAVIIDKKTGNVLLIKRRNLPVIQNRGIWSFLFGGKNKDEKYIETAYREIREETGVLNENLTLFSSPIKTIIIDIRSNKRWYNRTYLFFSNTNKIKLSIENSKYRWADPSDIFLGNNYTNVFSKKKEIEELIKDALKQLKYYKNKN